MNYNIDLNKSFNKLKAMIIEKKIESTQHVEIKLPFYSKEDNTYSLITEAEGIINVYVSKLGGFLSIIARAKENASPVDYARALRGEEVPAKEFWDAYRKATEILAEIHPNPLMKLRTETELVK